MAEVKGFVPEEESVTLEINHLPASVLTLERKEAENPENESVQPLLGHKHQGSGDEDHRAGTHTAADGADRKTSVPQELELAGRDQPGCSGSVRSLCSDSSQHECPICSEPLDSHGDHRVTLLHCNHALCHHCTDGIMSRARDTSRLQCPLCRQTTPFPQWEIWRLQEESYCTGDYEQAQTAISAGPELQEAPASPLCCLTLERQLEAHTQRNTCGCCVDPSCLVRGLRVMRVHSVCLAASALLLLFLVLLGCFLYTVLPLIMLSILFSNG